MNGITLGAIIFFSVIAVVAYLCLVIKLGFVVSDATQGTGFDAGFYMITVCGGIALPIAIAVACLK